MRMRNSFGEGTSPALHGDTVVLLWDHEGDSALYALDKRPASSSGKTIATKPLAGAPRS